MSRLCSLHWNVLAFSGQPYKFGPSSEPRAQSFGRLRLTFGLWITRCQCPALGLKSSKSVVLLSVATSSSLSSVSGCTTSTCPSGSAPRIYSNGWKVLLLATTYALKAGMGRGFYLDCHVTALMSRNSLIHIAEKLGWPRVECLRRAWLMCAVCHRHQEIAYLHQSDRATGAHDAEKEN
jgi:hypothetical protein